MTIAAMLEFSCGACGIALRLPGQYGGLRSRCPGCRGIVSVPKGLPGEIRVAHRVCNTCGGEVSAQDQQSQGLGEVFCRECLEEMCEQSDSTLLRQIGIEDLERGASGPDSDPASDTTLQEKSGEQKTRVWRRSARIPDLEPDGQDPFRPD